MTALNSEPRRHDFAEVLAELRSVARSKMARGRLFERLMCEYLRKDPIWGPRFASVQLIDGKDFGVDLEAISADGKSVWAIQCKFHGPSTRINKKAVSSFLAELGKTKYTHGLIIDTGAEWGATASRAIRGLDKPVHLLKFLDLEGSDVDWPDLAGDLKDLQVRRGSYELRPHQKSAIEDVLLGLSKSGRGKLIMACGTGKTLTALRLAEEYVGQGNTCLYLVPSIALMQQTLREWASQQRIPQSYVGICSDVRAGRIAEDIDLFELELPVTTDPRQIRSVLKSDPGGQLRVVFCTYQSIELVIEAQRDECVKEFDLIICDEAHRTTGVEKPGDKQSPFVRVHDDSMVRGRKRLYMTATPRLYASSSKKRANDQNFDIYSMDDEATYGPEFHRLDFGEAVNKGLLTDYKVLVLHMHQRYAARLLAKTLDKHADGPGVGSKTLSELMTVDDAARIAGCWTGLLDPELAAPAAEYKHLPSPKLKRAIAFSSRINASKLIESSFEVVANTITPERVGQMQVKHVDGTNNALNRSRDIAWLRHGDESSCRMLTNARCLSEGIDVPALDAVLFMNPRRSHIDIVQAVGRVMRKSPGKQYGYIILPVIVGARSNVGEMMLHSDYDVVWDVLRALRSHDGRLDIEINQIDLNNKLPDRISFVGLDVGEDDEFVVEPLVTKNATQLELGLLPEAMYAAIVDKVGDRQYWDRWARDIGEIASRCTARIRALREGNSEIATEFSDFHNGIKSITNDSVQASEVESMLAQHLITRPVFEALFAESKFVEENPVSKAMQRMVEILQRRGLDAEIEKFQSFYDSVRNRVFGVSDAAGKQVVLKELYEKFFKTAFAQTTDRLGIVYTPNEIVDFILRSADDIVREQFGASGLSADGVHVLEPFAGTGTFLVNLIQDKSLLGESDVARKFDRELHANEILPLAYYIGALNIERAFQGRCPGIDYKSFTGMVLADTFNLSEGARSQRQFPRKYFGENNERAESQENEDIRVFLSNPPWSAWQSDARDENRNVSYPALDARIRETYVANSNATQRASLYDSYIRAIRWASDRMGDRGLIAFVTNNGWLDGRAAAGLRHCLASEFNEIYIYDLRGNARTSGETWKREGGKVFGQSSRAGVCIVILIRSNPVNGHAKARINYRAVDDYLTTAQKLAAVEVAASINGIDKWQEIHPDDHGDWLNQRDLRFQTYSAIGDPRNKGAFAEQAIFGLYGGGLKTSRDEYAYSFDEEALAARSIRMIMFYNQFLGAEAPPANDELIKWHHDVLSNASRKIPARWESDSIRTVAYRPFVNQFAHFDIIFNARHYQLGAMYPTASTINRVISVTRQS